MTQRKQSKKSVSADHVTTRLFFALQTHKLKRRNGHAVAVSPDHDRPHLSRVQRARHPLQRCYGLSDIA
jgi:hypothetical protein